MKKSLIFLLALSLLLLSACRSPDQQPDVPTATAYFRNLSAEVWGDWLAAETTAIRMDQDPVDLVKALVEAMRTPRNLAHGSLLEENIQLEHASLEDGLLGETVQVSEPHRQLMREISNRILEYENYLPDDFDYAAHVCKVTGTYCC